MWRGVAAVLCAQQQHTDLVHQAGDGRALCIKRQADRLEAVRRRSRGLLPVETPRLRLQAGLHGEREFWHSSVCMV
jgi:hypothetical protein